MSENEKDLDAIYEKVSSTIKILGGDEVWKIFVTEFKGISDCAKRLDQLSKILRVESKYGSTLMTYEERNGFFTINIEGSCDIEGSSLDLDNLYDDYRDELTKDDIQIFFSLLPQKDDFWGWYYRLYWNNHTNAEPYMELLLGVIIAALIDPDYKETVNIIYNGEEICEVER